MRGALFVSLTLDRLIERKNNDSKIIVKISSKTTNAHLCQSLLSRWLYLVPSSRDCKHMGS
jgi:hypothetical protein